ncbi:MAG TPA: hypothetical protein DCW31_08870 [Lactobacillus sp.]|nr:hypothetical protein [Lactobacillus sp.]
MGGSFLFIWCMGNQSTINNRIKRRQLGDQLAFAVEYDKLHVTDCPEENIIFHSLVCGVAASLDTSNSFAT